MDVGLEVRPGIGRLAQKCAFGAVFRLEVFERGCLRPRGALGRGVWLSGVLCSGVGCLAQTFALG